MRSGHRFGIFVACALAVAPAGAVWAASTPSWEPVPPLGTARGQHTATLLQDGRVLVAGGATQWNAGTRLADVELYDPASKTWAPAAPLGAARSGHAAVLLSNGQVLVAGGRSWAP